MSSVCSNASWKTILVMIRVMIVDRYYLLSWHVQYDVAVYTARDTMFDWLSADNGTARLGQH